MRLARPDERVMPTGPPTPLPRLQAVCRSRSALRGRMAREVAGARRLAVGRLQVSSSGPLDRLETRPAVPASASDREQYTVRDPRLQGRLPGSCSWAQARMLRRLGDDWQAHYGPGGSPSASSTPPASTAPSIGAGNWRYLGDTRGFARHNGRYTDPASRSSCTCTPCGGTLAVGWRSPATALEVGARVLPRSRPVNCARWFRSWRRSRIFGAPRGASIPWPRCSPSTFSPGWRTCAVRSAEALAVGTGGDRRLEEPPDRPLRQVHPAPGDLRGGSGRDRGRAPPVLDAETATGPSRWTKRIRGANRNGDGHFETATLHTTGLPLATLSFNEEGGEIAAVRALLEKVEVGGGSSPSTRCTPPARPRA